MSRSVSISCCTLPRRSGLSEVGTASCVRDLDNPCALSVLRFAQCAFKAVSESSPPSVSATVRLRSSMFVFVERDRRRAARTERGAPSPLRSESATSAESEFESGGRSGPGMGIRRDMLPLADRGRKLGDGDTSSGAGRAERSGDGGRGNREGLVGVRGSAGEDDERSWYGGFDVAGVKNGVASD